MAQGQDVDHRMQRARWMAAHVVPVEPVLRTWLARRLPVTLAVDDVVQETYMALSEVGDVTAIQNVSAYVFAVARSVIARHCRRDNVVAIDAMAENQHAALISDEVGADVRIAAVQELRLLGRWIADLPPKCRQAFTLRRIECLSQADIAKRMDISESTVEKHIVKALRNLMSRRAALMADLDIGSPDQGQQVRYGTQGEQPRH